MIETKNSAVEVFEGLAQLVTYAVKSLQQQSSVWGLVTNGKGYQFVRFEHPAPSLKIQILIRSPRVDKAASI
ncbi:hypothetical protein [Scytonema sp. NUACC21]